LPFSFYRIPFGLLSVAEPQPNLLRIAKTAINAKIAIIENNSKTFTEATKYTEKHRCGRRSFWGVEIRFERDSREKCSHGEFRQKITPVFFLNYKEF